MYVLYKPIKVLNIGNFTNSKLEKTSALKIKS